MLDESEINMPFPAVNSTESAVLTMLLLTSTRSPVTNFSDELGDLNWSNESESTSTTSVPRMYSNYSDEYNSSEYGNCTNDYCLTDDEYYDMVFKHIYPLHYEWALIAMHSLVFFVGLVGNALVCVAVYRNHTMRTVTNYFIVNLAVADFMVILLCLPPTVLWDVTETWFMGTVCCKVVVYLQTVSVAVSVLTLTFISVDRWYAICFPLKFKSTTGRAKKAIIVIWLLALAFDIPELVVLEAIRKEDWSLDTVLFTQCEANWEHNAERTFSIIKAAVLYTCPLVFMSVAYCQIVRVLWRSDNIPGHTETAKYQIASCNNGSSDQRARIRRNGGFRLVRKMVTTGRRATTINMANANVSTEGQLRSRRKAAKMLVAVVIMFAICYLPVHLMNILRYTMEVPQNDTTVVIALISHWLCYANSAVNPIIYNFMSGKYRKEFRRTFGFWWCRVERKHSRARRNTNAYSSTFICRYTTGGSTLHTPRTEMVPLSGVTSASCNINDVD